MLMFWVREAGECYTNWVLFVRHMRLFPGLFPDEDLYLHFPERGDDGLH